MRTPLIAFLMGAALLGTVSAGLAQTRFPGRRGGMPSQPTQYPYGGGFLAPTFDREGKKQYFPHGGWYQPRSYYYYPFAGFGPYGLYSWHYGSPYPTAYPYSYYYGPPPIITPDARFGTLDVRGVGFRLIYWWRPYSGSDSYELTQAQARGWQRGYQAAREEERLRALERLWASVIVRVEPRQAALYLDGNLIGTAADFTRSGAVLRLPPGKYLLEAASPGYRSIGLELNLRPGESVRVDRTLQRETPPEPGPPGASSSESPRGRLVLNVRPREARVYLDQRLLGFAASLPEMRCLRSLRAGPHTVLVRSDGIPDHRQEVWVTPLRVVEHSIEARHSVIGEKPGSS